VFTLGRRGQFIQPGADTARQVGALLLKQTQLRQQQQGVFGDSLGSARGPG
jgi:hypothetical protein